MIPDELQKEIINYCKVNNITNIDEFTLKLVKQGFTVEKFGATPVTIEKIVEKLVEVPVEKIVEKLVEVPVVMVDTQVSEELKKYIELHKVLQIEMNNLTGINEGLKKELAEEKNKKKNTDIYGES